MVTETVFFLCIYYQISLIFIFIHGNLLTKYIKRFILLSVYKLRMRFIFPESIKWEPTQYWLLLGHIRAQNPSFGLKSGLWGELVISRSSSAHIFRGSLPFMFMGTDISMFFSFYSLFFQLQDHAISFVHTFLCILPCRIFSCEVCVTEGFHI